MISKNLHTKLLAFLLFTFLLTAIACEKEEEPVPPFNSNGLPNLEKNFVLDESRLFLNYVMPQDTYNDFINVDVNFSLVSRKVYEYFKDDFDFVFIFTEEKVQPTGSPYGEAKLVSSSIEGLGFSPFDDAPFYGIEPSNEATRLKSILYLPLVEYIRIGPFLHEIAHNWGNRGFLPTTIRYHWGYSSVGGQLGGFDELEDLGGGKYRGDMRGRGNFGINANRGNSVPYSNTELYLMGMIPASELQSIQVAENPQNIEGDGLFLADNIRTYTATELIAEHGLRSPAFEDAQKAFKAITVIISTSPVSNERKELLKTNLSAFVKQGEPSGNWSGTYNFWKATNGLGSIDIKIENVNLK